ncbi:MarR family transcriptional regulator [Clostridiaceae bacterium 35-E11]
MTQGDHSIGKWISIIYRYGQSYIEKRLQPYNIGSGQYIFLLILLRKDGISQEALSNNLNIDKGTTARAIQKLEKEGYVVRRVDTNDRRAYKIYVTDKAQQIKPILYKVLSEWTKILGTDLTEEETTIVLSILKRMAKNAAQFMAQHIE